MKIKQIYSAHIDPIIQDLLEWNERARAYLEDFKTSDGTYALHDNDRNDNRNAWHDQIIAVKPSGPSFDLKKGDIGLGSIEADLVTGGWDWNLELLVLLQKNLKMAIRFQGLCYLEEH